MTPALDRIAKLLRVALISDRPGEIVNAVSAVRHALQAANFDAHHFITLAVAALEEPKPEAKRRPEPGTQKLRPWQTTARWALKLGEGLLNAKELVFLRDMAGWQRRPSARQMDWLQALAVRVGRRAE